MLDIMFIGSCITVIDQRPAGQELMKLRPLGPTPAPPWGKWEFCGQLWSVLGGAGSRLMSGTFLCEHLW